MVGYDKAGERCAAAAHFFIISSSRLASSLSKNSAPQLGESLGFGLEERRGSVIDSLSVKLSFFEARVERQDQCSLGYITTRHRAEAHDGLLIKKSIVGPSWAAGGHGVPTDRKGRIVCCTAVVVIVKLNYH